MVNQAHHEVSFWKSLNESTMKDHGPIVNTRGIDAAWRAGILGVPSPLKSGKSQLQRAESIGSHLGRSDSIGQYLGRVDSISVDQLAEGFLDRRIREEFSEADFWTVSGSSDPRLANRTVESVSRQCSYDFLSDVDVSGGSALLPLFDEIVEDGAVTSGNSQTLPLDAKLRSQSDSPDKGQAESTPPHEKSHNTMHDRKDSEDTVDGRSSNPNSSSSDSGADPPLRRGLRQRKQPKQYQQPREDDGSEGEWAPSSKRKCVGTKRSRSAQSRVRAKGAGIKKELEDGEVEGSQRQERALPPNLDEKQRRRILRNRASAERSRLKRLGRIEQLQQENNNLRMQLQMNSGGSGSDSNGSKNQGKLAVENRNLQNEVQMLNERVRTLTALLMASRDQQGQQNRRHMQQQAMQVGF